MKHVIFRVPFSNDVNAPIRPSCGSVFRVLPRSYFDVTYVIQRTTLHLDHLVDEQYLSRWSNITVHYDLCLCS